MRTDNFGQNLLIGLRIGVYAGAAYTGGSACFKLAQGGLGIALKVTGSVIEVFGKNSIGNKLQRYGNKCVYVCTRHEYFSDIIQIAGLVLLGLALEQSKLHLTGSNSTVSDSGIGNFFKEFFTIPRAPCSSSEGYYKYVKCIGSQCTDEVGKVCNKIIDFLVNDFRFLKY